MGSIRTALVPLVAMPVSLVGAAIVHVRVRLQPEPPDDPRDRAVGRPGGGRRDRGGRERRAARARGQDADRGGAGRRARAGRPDHRDDDHAGRGLHADRLPGRPDRLAVPRVRDHAGRGGGRVGDRRGHAVAGDELAVRARAGQGRPADRAWSTAVRSWCAAATRGCSTARWRCAGRSSRRRC